MLAAGLLAGVAVVPATLITDYETGVGMPEPSDLDAIQSALEWAAVEFTNGGAAGGADEEVKMTSDGKQIVPNQAAKRAALLFERQQQSERRVTDEERRHSNMLAKTDPTSRATLGARRGRGGDREEEEAKPKRPA